MLNTPSAVSPDTLKTRLRAMPEDWRQVVAPYLDEWAPRGLFRDAESGALFVGHRPEVAPLNFAIHMFPPATLDDIEKYEKTVGVKIPETAKAFLSAFNGAGFFEFTLKGADAFYAQSPWPENRPDWHCRDMGTQHVVQQRLAKGHRIPVVFADRNSGMERVLSYAERSDGRIAAIDRQGALAGEWTNPFEWLSTELRAASAFTAEWSAAMGAMLRGR